MRAVEISLLRVKPAEFLEQVGGLRVLGTESFLVDRQRAPVVLGGCRVVPELLDSLTQVSEHVRDLGVIGSEELFAYLQYFQKQRTRLLVVPGLQIDRQHRIWPTIPVTRTNYFKTLPRPTTLTR